MIKSFKTAALEALWRGRLVKGMPADVAKVVKRKLVMIDGATTLDDLRAPPANRLEALRGDRAGQHSIRVNDQFRLCFVWRDGAHDVEFVDYH